MRGAARMLSLSSMRIAQSEIPNPQSPIPLALRVDERCLQSAIQLCRYHTNAIVRRQAESGRRSGFSSPGQATLTSYQTQIYRDCLTQRRKATKKRPWLQAFPYFVIFVASREIRRESTRAGTSRRRQGVGQPGEVTLAKALRAQRRLGDKSLEPWRSSRPPPTRGQALRET